MVRFWALWPARALCPRADLVRVAPPPAQVPILVTLGLLLEDDLRSEPDATAIPAHKCVPASRLSSTGAPFAD